MPLLSDSDVPLVNLKRDGPGALGLVGACRILPVVLGLLC
jgi:hypothetical protein